MKIVDENKILWAKVKENAIIPTKETENAGYDIYACFDEDFLIILPCETKLISSGIACALNEKYYLQLEERGSTGSKGIKRSSGVVDSSYRGEIFIAITNVNNIPIVISKINDKNKFLDLLIERGIENFFDNYILYPYNKAICQGIIHIVPQLKSEEITYEELCQYDSNRGTTKLGASKK